MALARDTDRRDSEDEALALALLAREPGSHRVAWARFAPVVRRVVRRYLGPSGDVEDVVAREALGMVERARARLLGAGEGRRREEDEVEGPGGPDGDRF